MSLINNNGSYNNYNYLYNAAGKTIAVKAGTEEAEKILADSSRNAKVVDGWVIFDDIKESDLKNAKSVTELDVMDVVNQFRKGNLTIEEFKNGPKQKV